MWVAYADNEEFEEDWQQLMCIGIGDSANKDLNNSKLDNWFRYESRKWALCEDAPYTNWGGTVPDSSSGGDNGWLDVALLLGVSVLDRVEGVDVTQLLPPFDDLKSLLHPRNAAVWWEEVQKRIDEDDGYSDEVNEYVDNDFGEIDENANDNFEVDEKDGAVAEDNVDYTQIVDAICERLHGDPSPEIVRLKAELSACREKNKRLAADCEKRLNDEPPRKKRKLNDSNSELEVVGLKAENEQLSVEIDRFKLIAAALKSQIAAGEEPRKSMYESVKGPLGMECTQSVKDLYEVHSIVSMPNFDASQEMISLHYENVCNTILRSLKTFVSIDGNKNTVLQNPFVSNYGQICNLNDILEKRKLTALYRVPTLVGGWGAFAKKNIERFAVLGRYWGFLSLETEWCDMFERTRCYARNRQYLFKFDVQSGADTQHIIIDPHEANNTELMLLYLNDVRCDLSTPEPTKEDKKLQNVRFVVVKENGWPSVFAVTSKKVSQGDELLIDYGQNFSDLLEENRREERVKSARIKQIDKNIVQGKLDDDDEVPVYRL